MYPKQRVSFKEKKKEKWLHPMVDYLRNRAVPAVKDIEEYYRLYALANGEIDEADYTHIVNPHNIKLKAGAGFPAKMKNIDIIGPNLQLMLAEKRERPILRYAVPLNVKGSDAETKETEIYKQGLQQFYINTLVAQGVAPEELEQAPPSINEIRKRTATIVDERAQQGQDALDYFDYFNELKRNFVKGFADYLTCGQVFTYKDINYEDLYYEVIPAIELAYILDSNSDFLEDSECVIRRKLMSINTVIEELEGEDGFTDKVREYLENKLSGNISGVSTSETFLRQAAQLLISRTLQTNLGSHENTDSISIEHIVFKSWAKIYEVTATDIFGNTITERYDEDYIPDEFEEYVEKWVQQYYEVYLLDEHFYIGFKPIPFTRRSMNNPHTCKNLYNGRVAATRFNSPNSWVRKGAEFQFKYNMVYYFLEKTLAKNKDQITILPLELLPDKEGWDETIALYYADATGFLFVDTEGDAKKMQALQYVKTLDMSLLNYIQNIYNILQAIKNDWDEMVGINSQRKGQIAASSGKAVTQEALYRGSMMSENIFAEFDEFQLREYQGMLDLSKYAWINGKKAQYRNSDGRKVMLEINPEKYAETEYGVFVDSSKEALTQRELINQIAFARAQNSTSSAEAVKMVAEKNVQTLIQTLEEMDAKLEQQQQQAQQGQQESIQAELEQKERHHQDNLELSYYEADLAASTKIEEALIKADVQTLGMDMNANNVDDSVEINKNSLQREQLNQKERLEREKLRLQEKIENKKLELAEKKIEADKFIAKVNKNKYDK